MVYGKGKTFEVKQPDESSLDKDGFIGTDPIYQNFADDTRKPLNGGEPSETEAEAAEVSTPEKTEGKKAESKKAEGKTEASEKI